MAQNSRSKHHKLVLLPSGHQGVVQAGVTVLDAARSLGVEIESICGGRQTCGKCIVEAEMGTFDKHGITSSPDNLSLPDQNELDYAAEHELDLGTRRLACAACIQGDIVFHVPPESQARKQVIRKAASELTLEVNPAVRLYYVEVDDASLGGLSDWDRVQKAMVEQWNLNDLTIDPLVLQDLHPSLKVGKNTVTLTLWSGSEVIRIEPGYEEGLFGCAIDIGSTTVACYLCDLRSGEILATTAAMNPQIRYGEDLMSRVSYAMSEPQGVARLHRAIISTLNDLIQEAAGEAEIQSGEICEMVVVGNTVMHHLFLGIDPTPLGGAPFTLSVQGAIDIPARDLKLKAVHPAAKVHVLPCIAGHVGADNVGVLLAERPMLDDQISLIVDIGTNAEILLGNQDQVFSASSPTGPAFEGAQITHGQRAAPGAIERVRIDRETGVVRYRVIGDDRWNDELADDESLRPTGICGSGIIEVVGELFSAGWIDSGGLFVQNAPERSQAIRYNDRTAEITIASGETTESGQDIIVNQNDIRAIQLAKAALYAGVRLLMDHMGVERVARVKLAGAFGSYIDPTYAMLIGMIPDCDLDDVRSIGNAAGDGARIALLNLEQRELAGREAAKVHYVETAVESSFQEHFVSAMDFPHATDAFPHLKDLLPDVAIKSERPSQRRKLRNNT